MSITTDETPVRRCGTETLGVDVGIKNLAVLSDGTVFENPKALRAAERRLTHLQRSVSRKQKGSANRRKAVARLARQHYRISCVRLNALHQTSNAIAKRAKVAVLETLNVSGMMKNHCIAGAMGDAAIAELHRQIEYKTAWGGGEVVRADRWFASSKTCSDCGAINHSLKLSDREWTCAACGSWHNRDENAAKNLEQLAASSAVENACGGLRRKAEPVKQEPNKAVGYA